MASHTTLWQAVAAFACSGVVLSGCADVPTPEPSDPAESASASYAPQQTSAELRGDDAESVSLDVASPTPGMVLTMAALPDEEDAVCGRLAGRVRWANGDSRPVRVDSLAPAPIERPFWGTAQGQSATIELRRVSDPADTGCSARLTLTSSPQGRPRESVWAPLTGGNTLVEGTQTSGESRIGASGASEPAVLDLDQVPVEVLPDATEYTSDVIMHLRYAHCGDRAGFRITPEAVGGRGGVLRPEVVGPGLSEYGFGDALVVPQGRRPSVQWRLRVRPVGRTSSACVMRVRATTVNDTVTRTFVDGRLAEPEPMPTALWRD